MIREIEGLRELEGYLQRVSTGLRGPLLWAAIQQATQAARDYAAEITHVITGSLQGAHETVMDSVRNEGRVQINRDARNPENDTPPYEYGVYEHGRGGGHSFYERTVDEAGDRIAGEALEMAVESIRNA